MSDGDLEGCSQLRDSHVEQAPSNRKAFQDGNDTLPPQPGALSQVIDGATPCPDRTLDRRFFVHVLNLRLR